MLAQLVAEAGFRDVETGTVTAVYETASPADFTQWIRDVAPPIGGKAMTVTFAFSCGPFECAEDFVEQTVRLRGGR
jgi:hypothetical protein